MTANYFGEYLIEQGLVTKESLDAALESLDREADQVLEKRRWLLRRAERAP